MAITRIWQSGAESGSIDELTTILSTFSVSTTQAKTGTYSFRDGDPFDIYGQVNFSSINKLRFGFFYYGNLGAQRNRVYFRNSSTILFKMVVELDGSCSFYAPVATFRGSSPTGNSASWKHIGIDIYFNASSGWIAVYTDGSENFSTTSINTGATACDNIIFGKMGALGTHLTYWDDLYIDDLTGESGPGAVPIKRFYSLTPNGVGTYNQWNPIPTGTHYANVDERPPNDDTDYLEAITGSLLDSFNMSTFALDNNENIIAMIPYVSAKRGGITEQISLGTRSSGTDLIGTAQNLSTSYNYYWERQITGSLGFDWNQSYMDSVQVLINSTGTY